MFKEQEVDDVFYEGSDCVGHMLEVTYHGRGRVVGIEDATIHHHPYISKYINKARLQTLHIYKKHLCKTKNIFSPGLTKLISSN